MLQRQAGLGTQVTLANLQVVGSTVTTLVEVTNAGIRSRGVDRFVEKQTWAIRGDRIATIRGEEDTSDPQTAKFLGVPVTARALPQTGDRAVPVPLVAGVGLVLVGLGLALRRMRRPAQQRSP